MSKLRLAVLIFAIGFSRDPLLHKPPDPRGAAKPDHDKWLASTTPGGGGRINDLPEQAT